ncbi:hypothetical protein L950_0200410 [Sphingobacterium sp. IITKGP-BTPF85]|nr:hypothetical protein L950_0200410 [Sphingobacterium sp. IITKGP-BTPF85]
MTYEASPFINIYLNGNLLSRVDDDHFKGEFELKNGEQVTFDGIDDVKTGGLIRIISPKVRWIHQF